MGDQRQDGHLVLDRVYRDCDRFTQSRGVRSGAHHAMSSRSLIGQKMNGETGCDSKSLGRERGVGFGLTVEGV